MPDIVNPMLEPFKHFSKAGGCSFPFLPKEAVACSHSRVNYSQPIDMTGDPGRENRAPARLCTPRAHISANHPNHNSSSRRRGHASRSWNNKTGLVITVIKLRIISNTQWFDHISRRDQFRKHLRGANGNRKQPAMP